LGHRHSECILAQRHGALATRSAPCLSRPKPFMSAASTLRHFLSKDCYTCRAQGYWVILNAERDKYFCVTHDDLISIGDRLHGWRILPVATEHSAEAQSVADRLIASLISSGILTTDQNQGKPFVESECLVVENALEAPSRSASITSSVRCVARFFLACARADWQLRQKALSQTLAGIRRRRLRGRSRFVGNDVIRASNLVSVFRQLRPLYPRPYLCLFDSIALAEFLARHGLFPRLTFGVIADPFEAHCWLQENSILLNDDLECVRKYIPILAV
jgi:Transglutaminase-like superfamily